MKLRGRMATLTTGHWQVAVADDKNAKKAEAAKVKEPVAADGGSDEGENEEEVDEEEEEEAADDGDQDDDGGDEDGDEDGDENGKEEVGLSYLYTNFEVVCWWLAGIDRVDVVGGVGKDN